MQVNRSYIYLLSFLEGGAVMACELIGAKLLAPYFGTSLYVWAAALGLTLGGLMTGYFLGGKISRRAKDSRTVLFSILVMAGFALFIMPLTSKWVMSATIGMPLQAGAVISLFVFMFPPLVFMGMVSPLIIHLLTQEAREAGNRAGNVYAISTLGGIVATFLMGFWIIPDYGITRPAMISGLLLAVLPAASLLRMRKAAAPVIFLFMFAGLYAFKPGQSTVEGNWQILYHSEGVLGQIKVLDFAPFEHEPDRICRGLVVNNTLQTVVDMQAPDKDFWQYTKVISDLVNADPARKRILVLGMGGGSLVKKLYSPGTQVNAVEIDERLETVSRHFFDLPSETPVHIDDARHFIRVDTATYNIIVFDIFKGESAPEHVLTRESLEDLKDNLRADGLLLINFYGYWNSRAGAIGKSVFKTLTHAGFQTGVLATSGTENERNLVFAASIQPRDSLLRRLSHTAAHQIPVEPSDTLGMPVLTDDHPQLYLYGLAAAQWRKLYNSFYTKKFSHFRFY